jgi:hypothetical protein
MKQLKPVGVLQSLRVINLVQLAKELEEDIVEPALKEKARRIRKQLQHIELLTDAAINKKVLDLRGSIDALNPAAAYKWAVDTYNAEYFKSDKDSNLKVAIAQELTNKWPSYPLWEKIANRDYSVSELL